uniref:Uncharacterized protein n=1 Tax=Romanomermis culicivorax TaxID=13658 RepID=A0A915J9B2_ROMCU
MSKDNQSVHDVEKLIVLTLAESSAEEDNDSDHMPLSVESIPECSQGHLGVLPLGLDANGLNTLRRLDFVGLPPNPIWRRLDFVGLPPNPI